MNAKLFCDLFHKSYDLEIDLKTLNPLERASFRSLSRIAGRYSPVEDDLKKYPGTYFSEQELKQKIIKVKDLLCRTR